MKSATGLFAFFLVGSMGGSAFAQDRALVDLASSKPNQFVSEVQQKLAALGYYSGDSGGLLGERTIAAINKACRDADLLATCQLGPLSPKGAAAVVMAIETLAAPPEAVPMPKPKPEAAPVTAEAPAVEAPAVEEAPAEEAPPAEVAEPAPPAVEPKVEMVGGWVGAVKNGLTLTPAETDGTVDVSIAGTAEADGWINAGVGRHDVADGANVAFSATITLTPAATSQVTAVARVALFDASGYKGELVRDGVPVATGSTAATEVAGTVPEGITQVQPYIQLTYMTGSVADDSLKIEDATLTVQ